MQSRNRFLTKTLTAIAAFGVCAPAIGHPQPADSADEAVSARDKATNAALLAALLERRAMVAASTQAEEDKRRALDWLDRRIAKVRRQIGS